jgi:hypothetical protein
MNELKSARITRSLFLLARDFITFRQLGVYSNTIATAPTKESASMFVARHASALLTVEDARRNVEDSARSVTLTVGMSLIECTRSLNSTGIPNVSIEFRLKAMSFTPCSCAKGPRSNALVIRSENYRSVAVKELKLYSLYRLRMCWNFASPSQKPSIEDEKYPDIARFT